MAKPTLPQGTRDFSPDTVRKRNYILSSIRKVFELYGYQPLETPAIENLETLMGKYGEEGDKLIFRVLNNGLNDPKNIEKSRAAFENVIQGKNDRNLTERALRYDLTIPFARYVAMNQGQLVFPFKRYQVQPVWRADRPQRGRYREFYQCDADVVGSTSLMNEVELALIYHQCFTALKMTGYELRINSRKILTALAEKLGIPSRLTDITIAIDKFDKIGIENVKKELVEKGVDADLVLIIETYLAGLETDDNYQKLNFIGELLSGTASAEKGIEELKFIIDNTAAYNIPIKIDFTLARGLDYYTGIIFEAKAPAAIKMGSIGGGGRYDDLTGLFGVPGIPGVGISFGVDRIYDVLEEMNLFPVDVVISTRVLLLNNSAAENGIAFQLAHELRNAGISCEIYPEPVKIDRQYKYAEKKNIPYVASINAEDKNVKLKDIRSGETKLSSFSNLVHLLTTLQ